MNATKELGAERERERASREELGVVLTDEDRAALESICKRLGLGPEDALVAFAGIAAIGALVVFPEHPDSDTEFVRRTLYGVSACAAYFNDVATAAPPQRRAGR